MKGQPLVSIIIPVFNVSLYIERCLESALNQTYPHIEYLLIDDKTPDDSLIKAQRLLEKSPRREHVKIYQHEKNRGLSAARNTGIRKATGEYIYFMDSDDELALDCIEELASLTINTTPDFVIGDIRVINGKRKKYTELSFDHVRIIRNEEIMNTFLCRKWYEMAWNKLVNRSFFMDNELWFYEGILHEDNLWSFMLAHKAKTMVVCKKETYHYYIHSQSISQSRTQRNIEHTIFVLEMMINWIRTEQRSIDIQLFGNYLNNIRIYLLKSLINSEISLHEKKEVKKKLNLIFKDEFFSSWKMPLKQTIKYFLLNLNL